jgi:hypothetical protein
LRCKRWGVAYSSTFSGAKYLFCSLNQSYAKKQFFRLTHNPRYKPYQSIGARILELRG